MNYTELRKSHNLGFLKKYVNKSNILEARFFFKKNDNKDAQFSNIKTVANYVKLAEKWGELNCNDKLSILKKLNSTKKLENFYIYNCGLEELLAYRVSQKNLKLIMVFFFDTCGHHCDTTCGHHL